MKPQGRPNVDHPVPGRSYLHPLYEKAHIFLTVDGDEAACGRPILIDEAWWVDSGMADRLGELWLVEANLNAKKGVADDKKCGDCSNYWSLHAEGLRARKKADIFTKKERPEAIAARNVQIESMKAWQAHFERFWGEPTELVLEAR